MSTLSEKDELILRSCVGRVVDKLRPLIREYRSAFGRSPEPYAATPGAGLGRFEDAVLEAFPTGAKLLGAGSYSVVVEWYGFAIKVMLRPDEDGTLPWLCAASALPHKNKPRVLMLENYSHVAVAVLPIYEKVSGELWGALSDMWWERESMTEVCVRDILKHYGASPEFIELYLSVWSEPNCDLHTGNFMLDSESGELIIIDPFSEA